ncbi:DUF1653 domain-containing protein [Aeromonas schubertii]|uniref:DUF1653 domain-containing protein n=1 Tax=Aeromonas schubertii TaxID=652 RepID=A0ABS7VCX6_9GAMM|nr:DUF1653 domain-containing protein [Aeromonas schubertii]MBZ6067223.1 DUF1653 domain-containing protein [Aeromonas schubertii]MBZ6071229.1 DUF1653 domain-containing protein [Aeromonas schubertii]
MVGKPLRTGLWRHYKGGLYEVLTEARHSERDELLVIYRSVEDGTCYARPKPMFVEWVRHDGRLMARFAPIEE